ncbi:PREDICTED: lipase member M-like, partial [Rhagoletis zephyria]|uniref:lipase member M-like n=1 Tax=Rhagoletis zephyria TaxID=28612 RepID=UPI0008115E41
QERIELRGFKHETHFIASKSGYILQTIRIVNPHISPSGRAKLKPILLQHGFQGSSAAWVSAATGQLRADGTYWEDVVHRRDPNAVGNTIGFVLATSGYDVWIGNTRGNIYSANHSTLSIDSKEFWDFSLDEIIREDLPAVIDYICEHTKSKKIAYIGHSQGTTMMFGLMATEKGVRYNHIVEPFIAMAPVCYFTNFKASEIKSLKPFKEKLFWLFPKSFGFGTFRKLPLANLCTNDWLRGNICYRMAMKTASVSQIDLDRVPVFIDNVFMGSSTRNLVHLLQQNHGLTYYDFGTAQQNMEHYGTAVPPAYNFSQITSQSLVEIHVKHDLLLDLENIQLLKNDLKVPFAYEYQVPDETWAHTDMILGKDVGKYVNSKVLEILKKY